MIINAFSGVALKPIIAVGELTLKQVAVVIKKVPQILQEQHLMERSR